MMMDALADGGVYAGVPKDIALKLTAYTMIVSYVYGVLHTVIHNPKSISSITPL